MDKTFVEAMRDNLGADSSEVEGVSFTHQPSGWMTEVMNPEPYRLAPKRMRGAMTLRDLNSFVAYINHVGHTEAEETLFDRDRGTYRCIFNHHGGWSDYEAIYSPRQTTAWKRWREYSGKFVTQDDFANFLEDRLGEIAEPDGAELLEMTKNLKVHVNVQWERAINTQTGAAQLIWKEDVNSGSVKVPEKLTLVVTPFVGGESISGHAQLKFTKPDSKGVVHFGVFLGEEFEDALDKAYDAMSDAIIAGTSIPIVQGAWGSSMKAAT